MRRPEIEAFKLRRSSRSWAEGLRLAARRAEAAPRATDLVLLVIALVGLAAAVIAYPPSGFEVALQRFLASVPGWLDPVWGFLSDLTWLFALVLIGHRRRAASICRARAGDRIARACGIPRDRRGAVRGWLLARRLGRRDRNSWRTSPSERASCRGNCGDRGRFAAPRTPLADTRAIGWWHSVWSGCTIVAGGAPLGTLASAAHRGRRGGRSQARRWHIGWTAQVSPRSSPPSPSLEWRPRNSRSPSGRSRACSTCAVWTKLAGRCS